MSTDNTLSNTLATLITTLTELKTALDRPQLDKAPDLDEYVKKDDLHDEVLDAVRESHIMSRIAQAVWDDVDYRDMASEIEQHLDIDVDDKVSEWMSNSFSASDYDLATKDYVDGAVSDAVDEKLDVERIVGLVKADMQLGPDLEHVKQIAAGAANTLLLTRAFKAAVRDALVQILTKGLDE